MAISLARWMIAFAVLRSAWCCSYPYVEQDIDWKRLEGVTDNWYQAFVAPKMVKYADCFTWQNITATEDGFTATILMTSVEDGYQEAKSSSYEIDRVRQSNGAYRPRNEHPAGLLKATKNVHGNKSEEFIKNTTKTVTIKYQTDMKFFTDYKTYFGFAVCASEELGWAAGGKTTTQVPTLEALVSWNNALRNNGIEESIKLTDICYGLDLD